MFGAKLTLGQLLVRKARDGVRVLVLLCAQSAPLTNLTLAQHESCCKARPILVLMTFLVHTGNDRTSQRLPVLFCIKTEVRYPTCAPTTCLQMAFWSPAMQSPIDVMHLRGAKGVMRTHDEETKDYFAHTNVKVRLAYKGSTQEKNFLRCGV